MERSAKVGTRIETKTRLTLKSSRSNESSNEESNVGRVLLSLGLVDVDLPVVDEDGSDVEVGESSKLELTGESGLDVPDLLLLLPSTRGSLLSVSEKENAKGARKSAWGRRGKNERRRDEPEGEVRRVDVLDENEGERRLATERMVASEGRTRLPAHQEGDSSNSSLGDVDGVSVDELEDVLLPVVVEHVVGGVEGSNGDVEDVWHAAVLSVSRGELEARARGKVRRGQTREREGRKEIDSPPQQSRKGRTRERF